MEENKKKQECSGSGKKTQMQEGQKNTHCATYSIVLYMKRDLETLNINVCIHIYICVCVLMCIRVCNMFCVKKSCSLLPVPEKMCVCVCVWLEMVIGMQNEILDGHRRSLFKRLIWKETWTLTIEGFDQHYDEHFESHLLGNGLYN